VAVSKRPRQRVGGEEAPLGHGAIVAVLRVARLTR
jgi:hypothetical protein